jgi:hypothetical protein
MIHRNQFRTILPILYAVQALFLGGQGLQIRNSILSQRLFENSTLWNSTARFHVWPWPFKFAVVQNMPAVLIGSLFAWPVDTFRPGLPEWISMLPALLSVPLLWYSIGFWLDQRRNAENNANSANRQWILLAVFTSICAAASSIPESVGGYVSYLPMGILVWITFGIAALANSRKPKSRITPSGRKSGS